jgi:hypothetical protein
MKAEGYGRETLLRHYNGPAAHSAINSGFWHICGERVGLLFGDYGR